MQEEAKRRHVVGSITSTAFIHELTSSFQTLAFGLTPSDYLDHDGLNLAASSSKRCFNHAFSSIPSLGLYRCENIAFVACVVEALDFQQHPTSAKALLFRPHFAYRKETTT